MAITMLNTQSLRTFRGFCENNNLSTLLNKYMEADGTMKPQYVTGDKGVEHDHKVAMALHKWNKGTDPSAVCALAHLRTIRQTCSWKRHSVALDTTWATMCSLTSLTMTMS
eukprot:2531197-Amphidinium_carterae.1